MDLNPEKRKALKDLRESLNLSQREAANRASKSLRDKVTPDAVTIGRWETEGKVGSEEAYNNLLQAYQIERFTRRDDQNDAMGKLGVAFPDVPFAQRQAAGG